MAKFAPCHSHLPEGNSLPVNPPPNVFAHIGAETATLLCPGLAVKPTRLKSISRRSST